MSQGTILDVASRQWATRPDDERYLSLDELHAAVALRKDQSWTKAQRAGYMRVLASEDGAQPLAVQVKNHMTGRERILEPTHWAFGQLAYYAKAPAAYLRSLPDPLAAINLQWGLEHRPMCDEALILGHSNGRDSLRSMTSVKYGAHLGSRSRRGGAERAVLRQLADPGSLIRQSESEARDDALRE